jgi:Domain of unknown function (DUF4956)
MKPLLDNVLLRLLIYYTAVVGAFALIVRAFPWIAEAVARERARGVVAITDNATPFLPTSVPVSDLQVLIPIVLTLLGALALALPVAFVYEWTRDPEPYRRDFGRALIALPIAVALAVFLVKNSLALAFSLAGIVAAIRWRAALHETMDGIFMFVVIGIGLAAGVQLLMVALVASVLFNLLILTLSRSAYATRPRQLDGWILTAPVERVAGEPRRIVRIRVEASDQARAAAHVETALALATKRWDKLTVKPQPDGRVRLEYRATLKKRTTPEMLREALAAPAVPEITAVTTTIEA